MICNRLRVTRNPQFRPVPRPVSALTPGNSRNERASFSCRARQRVSPRNGLEELRASRRRSCSSWCANVLRARRRAIPESEICDRGLMKMREARVVIIGGGFGGLNCARQLARRRDVSITLIDRRNYHLFQPLLYQVAMAGLSPGDIAAPIRGLFSRRSNVHVVQNEVEAILPDSRRVLGSAGSYDYDYLVLATGAQHAYFGHDEWEDHAPGLKTLEQATEIRRRVLSAFERAECERDATR